MSNILPGYTIPDMINIIFQKTIENKPDPSDPSEPAEPAEPSEPPEPSEPAEPAEPPLRPPTNRERELVRENNHLKEQVENITQTYIETKLELNNMTARYWEEKDQDIIQYMTAETERDQCAEERDELARERDQIAEERDKLREELETLKLDLKIYRTGIQTKEKEREQYFQRMRDVQEDRDLSRKNYANACKMYEEMKKKFEQSLNANRDLQSQRDQFRRLSHELSRELDDAKRHCGEELFEQDPPIKYTQEQIQRDDIPEMFLCPITHCIIQDPLVDREGNSYERNAIIKCLQRDLRSPITRTTLYPATGYLCPNRSLQEAIQKWFEEH